MGRRSWPIAANPVSGTETWDGGLTQTLLPVSVVTATEAVTWTGGATADQWPISVDLGTGALTYSAAGSGAAGGASLPLLLVSSA